ncbi:MAG: hypothetical protein IJ887_06770 [Prevotella sp.]|nr:hypothetical protein [Prevotella sp.]MBR3479406.1 hypothetical protein [Prevotella sp.]
MKPKRRKRPFINIYTIIVTVLALTRVVFPSLANNEPVMTIVPAASEENLAYASQYSNGTTLPHPILSVPSYDECFPDSNHVQLTAAQRWGVAPVRDRQEAEARKSDLVYVGSSPFYHVDPLYQSIPYLVPRAAILLQDIGQAFYDSLHVKGLPLQQFIVTSVLRTKADISRLRQFNGNATENSCHLFGTTFDISYTRYGALKVPGERKRWEVRDDTLKYILSEVLHDARQQGRCYIKYEKKQKCFHITVR